MTKLDWDKAKRQKEIGYRKEARVKRHAQPPSQKQRSFIKGLCRQLGISEPDGIATSSGASNVIEDLKRRKERRATKAGGA